MHHAQGMHGVPKHTGLGSMLEQLRRSSRGRGRRFRLGLDLGLLQKEAADHLIDRHGIEVPAHISIERETTQEHNQKKRYFELCDLVAQWAQKNLEITV